MIISVRRYRERWRGGHVGKKENRGLFPGFRFILRLRTILDAQSLFQPITEHLREIETFFFCQII